MGEPKTREYAEELALAVGCTAEEAAGAISQVLRAVGVVADTLAEICRKLAAVFEELEAAPDTPPPRSLRTVWERQKRRAYEQRVRAEIKRHDRVRLYRRVYKPP